MCSILFWIFIYIYLIMNVCNALSVSIYHKIANLLTDCQTRCISQVVSGPYIACVFQLTFFSTFLNFCIHPNGQVSVINMKLIIHLSQKTFFFSRFKSIAYKSQKEYSVWNHEVQNNSEYFWIPDFFCSKLMFAIIEVMNIA